MESKINIILAVESGNPNIPLHLDGSLACPRKWFRLTTENVDQYIFGGFVNEILDNIGNHPVPGEYDMQKNIIWDNFIAHKTAYFTHIIHGHNSLDHFRSVDRPPYCPKIAPYRACFCELVAELARRCTVNG